MTGETGTPRYMAPEIALNQPYEASSDTYSFCMLLWEILAMKIPFELYSMKSFRARVWQAPHKRPQLDESWPVEIRLLLQRGLSATPSERQPMSIVAETLEKQIVAGCSGESQVGLERDTRRSTFVWEPERSSSNATMFSLLSSPFAKKSPFPHPGSALSSSTRKKKGVLDGTKDTQQMLRRSLSIINSTRLQVEMTSTLNGQKMESAASVGLPQIPPLFQDDDPVEESGADTTPGLDLEATERVRSDDEDALKLCLASNEPAPDGKDGHASEQKGGAVAENERLWKIIEAERRRREAIRAHIDVVKAS
jgi:serine/threonine protein kinase